MENRINFFVASLFLLILGFAVLVGENMPEEKSDFSPLETSGGIVLESGQTLIIENAPRILHSCFATGDYRQEIVQEAYYLGGLDFVALLECENGLRDLRRVGDCGQSHGLCQLNQRWHREVYDGRRPSREFQLSVCYQKRKGGTKFYGPQRKIRGKELKSL